MIQQVHASGFRRMQSMDLPAVMEIENQSYEFPWSEGIFRDCLANRYNSVLYIEKQQVQAYTISQNIIDECHLLNLCVRQDARNHGLGKKMVQYLINQARQNDMESIFLEVRVSNEAAIHLYDKLGFNEIGLRRGYYPTSKGREDAFVLAYELL